MRNTVMIHSCNARMWYVKDFLIPQFEKKNAMVILWNDDYELGCLKSFVASAKAIKTNLGNSGGMWHAQDDILLSENFYENDFYSDKIVNAFVTRNFNPENAKFTGEQPISLYWYSFQLWYCPNRYMCEFFDWFIEECIRKGKYRDKVILNKYDDFFFWQFMKAKHPTDIIINHAPNLAQHIDYMLGGSVINKHHKAMNRAAYWNEEDAEKKLEQILKTRRC